MLIAEYQDSSSAEATDGALDNVAGCGGADGADSAVIIGRGASGAAFCAGVVPSTAGAALVTAEALPGPGPCISANAVAEGDALVSVFATMDRFIPPSIQR
jgi:hypothetical protein